MLNGIKYRFGGARYSKYTRYLIKYGGNAIPQPACLESIIAILPLDVPCFGRVTHSEEILTTGKCHKKNPDGLNIMRN
jgi:hypothetical protein